MEKKSLKISTRTYADGRTSTIDVANCFKFTIENLGNVTFRLFGGDEILPYDERTYSSGDPNVSFSDSENIEFNPQQIGEEIKYKITTYKAI